MSWYTSSGMTCGWDISQGVCTSWLAELRPGSERVPVWVQTGVLRLPADPTLPLLLVGPGTGVAPFRSFVEDRQAHIDAGGQKLCCCMQARELHRRRAVQAGNAACS